MPVNATDNIELVVFILVKVSFEFNVYDQPKYILSIFLECYACYHVFIFSYAIHFCCLSPNDALCEIYHKHM